MDSALLLFALLALGALAYANERRLRNPFFIAAWFWASVGVWHSASHEGPRLLCQRAPDATPCPLRNATNIVDLAPVAAEFRHFSDVGKSIAADSLGFVRDAAWAEGTGFMTKSKIASVGRQQQIEMLAQACKAMCRARRLESCIEGTAEAVTLAGSAKDLEEMVRKLETGIADFGVTLRARTVAQFYDDERPSLLQMVQFLWERFRGP